MRAAAQRTQTMRLAKDLPKTLYTDHIKDFPRVVCQHR